MTNLRPPAAALAALSLFFVSHLCEARTEPRHGKLEGEAAQSLLFVGNSYYYFNNGMHRYVNGLSNADKSTRLRSVLVGIGGSGIDWHDVDSYLRPGSRLGSYSFIQGQ